MSRTNVNIIWQEQLFRFWNVLRLRKREAEAIMAEAEAVGLKGRSPGG